MSGMMGGGRSRDDMPAPPRAMARSAEKGNRRRAWPRWTRPALRAGLLLVPLLGVAGSAAWAWRSGTLEQSVHSVEERLIALTARAGFAINDVMVEGRTETNGDAILRALGAGRGDPILAVDLAEAKARLEDLPWVATASVERRLPDILFVRLTEREPMAVWQHGRQFTVIDRKGRSLADAYDLARRGNNRIETLPHIVGDEAPAHVPDLLDALDAVPTLHAQVAAATWVSDRRWDLTMKNGILVKLPEADYPHALRQLAALNESGHVLDRDIVAIDLRQPDKATIQASETAVLPWTEDDKKKKPGKKT